VNTTLSTPVDQHNHTHPPSPPEVRVRVRTVSIADRAALHLGLALITWSRRDHAVIRTVVVADERTRREQALARAERERHWQLASYLNHSPR
jgi:hypothetical protein